MSSSASMFQSQKERSSTSRAAAINADKGAGPAADNVHGLPSTIQAKMESAMNADFSNVNIHKNSSQASSLGAHAYTQGNDVHFAPGKFDSTSSKGQELIGHELAHVVQQRQGRVQPTAQAKGMPVNDNDGLEAEADRIGAKAAKAPFSSTLSNTNTTAPAQMKAASVVQMWNPFKKKKNKPDLGNGKTYTNPTSSVDNDQHGVNPTKKVTFNENIGNSGSNKGFFKKAETGVSGEGGGGYEQGIFNTNPFTNEKESIRGSARSVASSRLDKALGTNVLSEEQFAEVDGEKGSVSGMVDGRQLIGKTVENDQVDYTMNYHDFKNPLTQKGMSDLQMLDFISSQTDRHGGNIFIGNGGQVKGIDNDVSFGSVNNTGKYGATEQQKERGVRGASKGVHNNVGLPSQVDSKTAQSILSIKAKNLGKILNDKTRGEDEKLNSKEIKAAQERYRQAKKHVRNLQKTGGIVDNWNEETYNKSVSEHVIEQFKGQDVREKHGNYISKHEGYRHNTNSAFGPLRSAKVEPVPEPQVQNNNAPQVQNPMPGLGGPPNKPLPELPMRLSPEQQKRQNMDKVLKEAFPFY